MSRYNSLILNLGTRQRRVVNFTAQLLYPWGRSPWYPLKSRVGGPQNQSRHFGEVKYLLTPPSIELHIIQPEASSQYQFCHPAT